ncbi:hypothetical protein BpHYR1_033537 [Brachionus plicatilis]|uniref:Uncharacterized protein n=1 Tax=Brachionus plicatilis TaxID=10195 RepID=A0A3M7QNP0_BRAPC|nr:hypothetical protein BpHYR1_033537 [Brachionus plicatilis]
MHQKLEVISKGKIGSYRNDEVLGILKEIEHLGREFKSLLHDMHFSQIHTKLENSACPEEISQVFTFKRKK